MIAEHHAALLASAAIGVDAAELAGVRSALSLDEVPESARWCGQFPGLVFPWRSPSGATVEQYRPDEPAMVDGVARKYLWPKGAGNVLNVHPSMAERLGLLADRLVEVETMTYRSARSVVLPKLSSV